MQAPTAAVEHSHSHNGYRVSSTKTKGAFKTITFKSKGFGWAKRIYKISYSGSDGQVYFRHRKWFFSVNKKQKIEVNKPPEDGVKRFVLMESLQSSGVIPTQKKLAILTHLGRREQVEVLKGIEKSNNSIDGNVEGSGGHDSEQKSEAQFLRDKLGLEEITPEIVNDVIEDDDKSPELASGIEHEVTEGKADTAKEGSEVKTLSQSGLQEDIVFERMNTEQKVDFICSCISGENSGSITSILETLKPIINDLLVGDYDPELQLKLFKDITQSSEAKSLLEDFNELPDELVSFLRIDLKTEAEQLQMLTLLENLNIKFAAQFLEGYFSDTQELYIKNLAPENKEYVRVQLGLEENSSLSLEKEQSTQQHRRLRQKQPVNRKKQAKAYLQYAPFKSSVTKVAGKAASMKAGPLKNLFIKWYINHYKIDMEEAVRTEASEYVNFNDFFCRELKSNARPICEGDTTLAHPVDGKVSQLGDIEEGKIIQAKNHDYSVETLLGGNPADAKPFENGTFATVYLSPADYHRVHMPIDGKLKKMIYVSGDHFSVGPNTAEHISGLFARNERVVCIFDTDIGEMAMVLVGATIVSSIQPAWEHKPVTARRGEKVSVWEYNTDASDAHVYKKGDEMGHFKLGSTVVMCFEKGKVSGFAEGTQENSKTTMGTKFAYTANHVTADQSVLSFHES